MIGLAALRRGARALCRGAIALALAYAVRRALMAQAQGDPRPFTRHTRRLRGTALRIYADLYYAALPVRGIELPAAPAPAPRIRDAVETPACAHPATIPAAAPALPTRGQVRVRSKEALSAVADDQARRALATGLCYAYHAAADRAAGRDRLYAVAALRARDCLQDALAAQPGGPVPPLALAIEALLHGQLAAAMAHLDGIAHTIGSEQCEVQR